MLQANKSFRRSLSSNSSSNSSSSPKPTSMSYTCAICFNICPPEFKSFQCQHQFPANQQGEAPRQCPRKICNVCFEDADNPSYECTEHKLAPYTRPQGPRLRTQPSRTNKRKSQVQVQDEEESDEEVNTKKSRVNKPCRGQFYFGAHADKGKGNYLTSGTCTNCNRSWCRECKKLYECCPSCVSSLLLNMKLGPDFAEHFDKCDRQQLLLQIKELQLSNKKLQDKLQAIEVQEVAELNKRLNPPRVVQRQITYPPSTKSPVLQSKPIEINHVESDPSSSEEQSADEGEETQIIPSPPVVVPKGLVVKLNGKEVMDIDEAEAFVKRAEEEENFQKNLVKRHENPFNSPPPQFSPLSPLTSHENNQLIDFFPPHFPITSDWPSSNSPPRKPYNVKEAHRAEKNRYLENK